MDGDAEPEAGVWVYRVQAVQDEDAIGERRIPEARQLHGTPLLARLAVGPCANIRLLDLDRREEHHMRSGTKEAITWLCMMRAYNIQMHH